jgi:hypothetical protein
MRRPTAALLLLLVAQVAGCARQPGLFSEANARAHVGMLAGTIGSRPVGTAANARAREYIIEQLRLFGYDVRVQETDARRPALGRTAHVSNIIAVRNGARPEALGIVSHYDSVPAGPGAGDDALGVAVSLEAARVLGARPNRPWTLMILVTDGEEADLMGAAGLMTDRDVSRRLQAYINLEAIGSADTPMLFQAGPGNDWLLRQWTRASPHPRGASLATEIYRYLPSDTDFSILKLHDIPGLNIAAVGDSYAYHTPLDTPDRLSPRTVREMGEQVVTVAASLDHVDITRRTRDERTFFDVLGISALSYGSTAGFAIAVLALVLGLIAWVKVGAALVAKSGFLRTLFAAVWIVASAALVIASLVGATWALRAAREVYHPWYARPGRLFLLIIAVGLMTAWSAARLGALLPARARSARDPLFAWLVALPIWLVVGELALWLAPGAAYLWLLPLLTAAVALAALPIRSPIVVRLISFIVLVVAATLWVRDIASLLRFTVATFGRLPLVTPVFVYPALIAFAGMMIAPPFVAASMASRPIVRPSLITSFLLLAVAVTAGSAYLAPAYTHDEPLRRYVRVLQEAGKRSVWDVGSVEPGLDLGDGAPGNWQPVDGAPEASLPIRRLPHPFVFRTSAPAIEAAPIGIASLAVDPVAGGTELSVSVVPRQPGLVLSFVMPAGVRPARASLPGVVRSGRWTATYVAPPADGVLFRASFGPGAAPSLNDFRVLATARGSTADQGWQLPSWLPRERTVWTAEATWVVDPFSLPIAPVPPLR